MKLISLKKNVYIHFKKYASLFLLLFFLAVLFLFEHFNESAFLLDDISSTETNQKKLAPNFTVINLKNNREGLSDYQGRVILLNLWATWCIPCRIEMKSFDSLYRRFRSKGLTVLAVNIGNESAETVQSFIEKQSLSFPVLLDKNRMVEKLYPTQTIPATFVIDKMGRIITVVDGAKNWVSEETFKAVKFLLNRS